MLPFLKRDKEVGSVSDSSPITRGHDEDYDFLESAAEDLCHAVEAKDYKAIASALRAAFEILESQPHQEGPHE